MRRALVLSVAALVLVGCHKAPKDPAALPGDDNYGRFTCKFREPDGRTGECDITLRNSRQLTGLPGCTFDPPKSR
jgi:hypothetical protein